MVGLFTILSLFLSYVLWIWSLGSVFMFTIFLQKPDNLNREKTVVSKVGKIEVSFPYVLFSRKPVAVLWLFLLI